MATNFNKPQNIRLGSNETKLQKKSKNWLVIILIIVFILFFIGLIFNTYRYFTTSSQPIQTLPGIGNSTDPSNMSSESPTDIVISLLGMFFTGNSLYLLLFLKSFDKRNYYNISHSFTFISNNRFFYISLFMGIIFAFYIGGISLFQNINMDMNMITSRSSFIQIIYSILAAILLIENYIKTGYSIPITLARTGIFLMIGITLLGAGYVLGMILFYIIMIWVVFKFFFGMIAAQNRRAEEQARMDRWASSVADAIARRLGLD